MRDRSYYLDAGNAAVPGAVEIKLSNKTFKVDILNSDSTLGDFSDAAEDVFDAFKANDTVVKKASVTYESAMFGTVTITNNNINNDQDFNTVIEKALARVGLDQDTALNVLENRWIKFEVEGVIGEKEKKFKDTYTFEFKSKSK